jgi:hypothetical protein
MCVNNTHILVTVNILKEIIIYILNLIMYDLFNLLHIFDNGVWVVRDKNRVIRTILRPVSSFSIINEKWQTPTLISYALWFNSYMFCI